MRFWQAKKRLKRLNGFGLKKARWRSKVNGSQWSDGRDVEQIGPEMALYENGAPFF
jgi:hypothetical protein